MTKINWGVGNKRLKKVKLKSWSLQQWKLNRSEEMWNEPKGKRAS